VDAAGHAYVVGQTAASNFPTTPGAVQTSFSGNPSAFVTDLNPTGTALVYSTYLGGNASTYGSAIALDAAGHAYVTGYTQASNFPTTPGAFQTTNPAGAGDNVAIVTELNPSATGLVYSTYLGGSGDTYGNGIALDAAGDAYVVGNTYASNFPTTPGAFQTSYSGNGSVIVTELNPTGTGLVYSTYLGGNNNSFGDGIAVDAAGDAYFTGETYAGNFPTTAGAFQTTNLAGAANGSAFVTELNPTGTGLVYSTDLSGTSSASGFGIAVDAAGQIYVMGTNYATNFPTTPGAFQTSFSGSNSSFVARFDDTTTTTLSSSTNPVVYGQPFTVTATVAAVDALDDGTPTGGTVTFTVNGFAQTPVALNQGVATLTMSNLTTGMDTIGASYSGSTPYDGSAATSIAETGTAATANQLVFGQQPTNITVGAALSPAVTVMIEDQYGNVVTADNTDQVTVAVATGPGAFSSSSTTTVTASGGIATFSNLVLNTLGSYTLSESASGALTGPVSSSFVVNAPARATSLAFGVQPANTAAGAAINPAVTVQILDQFGHVFSTDNTDQVTVAVAGGPGGFTGSSSTTANVSNGVATFSNLHLNTSGTYALSETASSSLTGPDSSSFTVTPTAANKLVFGQQPTITTAGAAITPAVTVLIEDPYGNLVSSDNTDQVTLGIASGPGSFSGASTTTVTASGGIATFVNLRLNTAGTYTLTDKAGSSFSGPASSSFDVTAGAVNRLAVTAFPSSITAGTSLGLNVTALDQFGNPTTDSGIVTFTSNDPLMPSPVSFLTTFSGDTAFAVATLKTATGTGWTVMVSDSTSHSGSSNPVPVTPAAANQLVFAQQPTNTTAGVALAPAVTLKIADPFGNLVTTDNTDAVTVRVASGPGSFTGASTTTVTASSGIAMFANLHFNTAGTYTLGETSGAGITGPSSNSFTVKPAAANQLVFGVPPSNTTAGAAIAPAVTVKIEDQFGNLVSSDSTDAVTVGIASGPGSLTGGSTTTVTASSGLATFSNLHLNTAGSYTLSESGLSGLTGPASNSFNVTPAAANQLVFGQQPTNTTAGAAIAPAVTVKIEDQFGNVVTSDSSDQVTVSIASGPGSFSGGSTTTVTASGGVATFGNLHLNTAGSYSLIETAPGGLTGPASNSFTITPAAANQLVFGVQPSNTTAGTAITPAVAVKIEDQFGNVVTTDTTDQVTLGIAMGPGTFSGSSTTTVTASAGVATFSNLQLNTAGSYTLSETASGGLTGPASNSFTVTPATANQLAFGQQPTTTTAGAPLSPAVTVLIEDQFGNLVTTDNTDAVTVGVASGSGSFTGASTTTVTASSGIATFANLHLNTAGTYTLTDTASSLSGPASSNFTVTAGAVDHLSVSAIPSSITAGTGLGLIVTALDPFGNPTTDSGTVTFTSNDPLVPSPVSFPTTFSGDTAFAVGTLKTATGTGWTIMATDSTSHSGTSNAVIVTPAAASHFTVSAPTITIAAIVTSTGAASESGATVTINTTTAHGFTVGQSVNIAGVGVAGYDGTVMITSVPTSNSFTYTALANNLGLAASGGGTVTSVATTGTAFNVVVTALDAYGNTATSYNGTVKLTSSDAAASFAVNTYTFTTTGPTPDNGVHTFSATLNTLGPSQSITATDTGNASLVGSTSGDISTVGLYLTAFAATPSGFTATFNKLLNLNQLDYYRFAGQTVPPDISMTVGSTTTAVAGSVVVSSTATQTTLTFVATQGALTVGQGYTVTLSSGSSGILDTSGGQFAGDANGVLAGTNYNVSVVPVPASMPTLSIPGFARGPNSSAPVLVPNTGSGIPVTLKNAPANTTSVTFTLDYNAALLNVTGPTSGTLVLNTVTSTPGVANFSFSTTTAISTSSQVLGQIVADVPSSAASQYKAKALLDLPVSLITIAGVSSPTYQSSDGVELNAYLGDVNADYQVNGSDAGLVSGVLSATSQPAGFAAYPLADPALVGSPNSNPSAGLKITTADVTLLNRFAAGLSPAQVPAPPTGLTYTSTGPDPSLSLPTDLQLSAGGTVTVPVILDDARPAGSTGLTEATLALTFDPSVFTVSAVDVHLGTVPASGSGWMLTTVVNAVTGQVGITLESATPITHPIGGSLVTIDFHARAGALLGPTSLALVATVNPTGQGLIQTNVFDSQGAFTLSPAPTNGAGDPVTGLVVLTAPTPVTTTAAAVGTEAAPTAGARTAAGDGADLTAGAEVLSAAVPVVPATAAAVVEEDEETPVADTAGERVVRSAAHVGGSGTDVVPGPINGSAAAQQAASLVLPFGKPPALCGSAAGTPQLADLWFPPWGRATADAFDRTLLLGTLDEASGGVPYGLRSSAPAGQDARDGLIWDDIDSDMDWLAAAGARRNPCAHRTPAATAPAVVTERAPLDQYFAGLADESVDPSPDDE
jgi:Beta-propeller repeat